MLQEYLVASEILPKLNVYSAILFLNAILKDDSTRKPEPKVTRFLYDYCKYYLAKHLPTALRHEKASILNLHKDELYKIIN